MTADQLEMISTDPGVMHGQAVIAGTRVPVTVAGVRAAAAYGAALAREELLPLPQSR